MKDTTKLHFRRCHMCDGVTESEEAPVDRCEHCGKPMAPFYFFDELGAPSLSDADLRPHVSKGERVPVRGLTAYW